MKTFKPPVTVSHSPAALSTRDLHGMFSKTDKQHFTGWFNTAFCMSYSLFLFDILNEGLDLSIVQLKWLGWDYNKVELLTTEFEWDNTMAPNLDKVEILPRGWLNSYDLLEN